MLAARLMCRPSRSLTIETRGGIQGHDHVDFAERMGVLLSADVVHIDGANGKAGCSCARLKEDAAPIPAANDFGVADLAFLDAFLHKS